MGQHKLQPNKGCPRPAGEPQKPVSGLQAIGSPDRFISLLGFHLAGVLSPVTFVHNRFTQLKRYFL